MPYIALCDDTYDSAELRAKSLQEHLAYVEEHQDKIAVAGPLGEKAQEYQASLFIYNVDSLTEAESLLYHDPYYRAGVYATVRFEPFQPAIGGWVGGKQW